MRLAARGLIRPRGFGRLLHAGSHPWVSLVIIVCVVALLIAVARRNR